MGNCSSLLSNTPEGSTRGDFSSVLDDAELIYLYDGSLEGMLTAVFAAYDRHEYPVNIVESTGLQENMLCSYVPIQTSVCSATRVKDGIIHTLGESYYEDIKRAFLSDDTQKGGVIYRYIRYAFRTGKWSYTHLAHAVVADFLDLRKKVDSEAHYMLQFVRFAHLNNGVFYAHIEPQASVVPLISDHFARRLNVQPFIIYDSVHSLASVFDTKGWWLVDASEIKIPDISEAEEDYQALWQTFYDTIAIEERRNPNCQRNFMPKRFWGNMCEHVPPALRKRRAQTQTPTNAARKLAAPHKQKLLKKADFP